MEKPPRTEAQINSARANGARSHGPVTEEGKAKSSQNSLKHGLTARAVLLPNENPEHFDELLAALHAQFSPETGIELLAVEEMAVALWKQRRIWTLESAALALHDDAGQAAHARLADADGPAETCLAWLRIQKALADFSWHDVRLQRQYTRSLKTLQTLQASRKNKKMENEPENPGHE